MAIPGFTPAHPEIMGEVYLLPEGRDRPTETLYVWRFRDGIKLVDRDGRSVRPKSARLGFNGVSRRGATATLVCEDGTDPHVLIAAGYANVVERG